MSNNLSTNATPETLAATFAHFNAVTDELIKAYQQLEIKVEELNNQLTQANDELLQKSQANAQLAQRLATLVNELPAGVIETDKQRQIISLNNAARMMLPGLQGRTHWSEAELLPQTDADGVIHVDDPQSGRMRYLTLQACPLDDLSTIFLLHDVGTLRHLHEQLAQQHKLASMGQMAASLAHQLRTPLATALLYAKNLERPTLSAEERLKFSRKIVDRLQALEGLTQEMLGFVRHNASGEQLARYSLPELVHELEQSFAPQCDGAGIHFQVHAVAMEQALLTCRPKELAAAMIGLLENALQHAPANGKITLEVLNGKDCLTFRVRDNGPGIPTELVPRIFEPFLPPGQTAPDLAWPSPSG
ncbi:sensor histidine kinase [Vogesella fluminis]|uniref:sensor histidine kinase n=1 Tax=Vogesella fluminis TaxID=1069161 RepID=UPI00363BD078